MKKLKHNVRVHIHKVTSNTPFFPSYVSPTSPYPASSLNCTTGGPCGSSMCQVAAPPLILLNQANTPTPNHKIKLQILADVQQSFSSLSHLPYEPGLIVLTLINPVLKALLSLHLFYSPGSRLSLLGAFPWRLSLLGS